MISVHNIQRFDGMDFETYKLLPQYNFSFLKRQRAGVATEVKRTDKIILGSLVDAILTGGEIDMRDKLYPHAKKIAAYLQAHYGSILPHVSAQVSFTGIFSYRGLILPVKGRPDFELKRRLIIDLKVSHAKDAYGTIKFMGYNDQQWGYAKLAGVKEAYILTYSVPLQKAEMITVPLGDDNDFWIDKIIKFGTAA